MTEDDTFRILRQIPFRDFYILLNEYMSLYNLSYFYQVPNEFYQKYGWTEGELREAWTNRYIQRR